VVASAYCILKNQYQFNSILSRIFGTKAKEIGFGFSRRMLKI